MQLVLRGGTRRREGRSWFCAGAQIFAQPTATFAGRWNTCVESKLVTLFAVVPLPMVSVPADSEIVPDPTVEAHREALTVASANESRNGVPFVVAGLGAG